MLTKAAASLFQLVELKTGVYPDTVVKQLQEAESKEPAKQMSVAEVEQMLIQAMPQHCEYIKQTSQQCQAATPKGDDGPGVSILEARVKTLNRVAQQRQQEPRRIDPYEVVFKMPKNTAHVLFFNCRKVDDTGRPAIMGISAREGADPSKIDSTIFYKPADHEVQTATVKAGAEFVRFKEENEPEFRAGDPILAVALDAKGRFISSDVTIRPLNEQTTEVYPGKLENNQWVPDTAQPVVQKWTNTGENLDQTPVVVNADRMEVIAKFRPDFSPQAWFGHTFKKGDLELNVLMKRGAIFEPGAYAKLSVLNATADVKVEGRDMEVAALPVRLPGSPTKLAKATLPDNINLQTLIQQPVTLQVGTAPGSSDARSTQRSLIEAIAPYYVKTKLMGQPLGHVNSGTLTPDIGVASASDAAQNRFSATKRPATEEEQKLAGNPKAHVASFDFAQGFVEIEGRPVKGLQLEIGYTDAAGKWTAGPRKTLSGEAASDATKMELLVPHPDELANQNGRVELRLYTPEGMPLKRALFPFHTIPWNEAIF